MLKGIAQRVVEKIIALMVLLAAVGVVVLVWRYHQALPSMRSIGRFLGGLAMWVTAATLLPWVTFFLVAWVQRANSNFPAVVLLVFWATLDAALAWWLLVDGSASPIQWSVVVLAFGLGGLYNLIAANQIANRLQRR